VNKELEGLFADSIAFVIPYCNIALKNELKFSTWEIREILHDSDIIAHLIYYLHCSNIFLSICSKILSLLVKFQQKLVYFRNWMQNPIRLRSRWWGYWISSFRLFYEFTRCNMPWSVSNLSIISKSAWATGNARTSQFPFTLWTTVLRAFQNAWYNKSMDFVCRVDFDFHLCRM